MSILNIQPATREGSHLLIQCFGGPRSGKTRTALRLARGIAGPAGKIGVLDTEAGRARLYSDKISGGFFVGDLTPPFTPKRYREAIEEFVAFGADVLVIDSFSHCWAGPGGVLELADQAEANGKKGLQKWLAPKVEYRKLITFLLSTNIHIVFCSRGKQPVVEGTDARGNKTLITMPWEPVQDKLLKYEMTVVLPMTLDGGYETDPTRMKAPDDIAHLFTGELLTEATGAAIAEWVSGGQPIDHAGELLRKRANDAATDGSEPFREFWKVLNAGQRDVLRPGIGNLQSIAEEADAEEARKIEIARENAERTDPNLDAPFGRQGIEHAAAETNPIPSAAAAEGVVMERDRYENGRMAEDRYQGLVSAQTAPPASESRDPIYTPPKRERTHSAPRADAAITITGQSGVEAQDLGYLHPAMAHAEGTQRPFATTATPASAAPISSAGPNATTAASRSKPTDLVGDPPAENLTVPLPRDAGARDLEYFARQMLAMIAEAPGDASRMARIQRSNEHGLGKLKAGGRATLSLAADYDAVMAALARR